MDSNFSVNLTLTNEDLLELKGLIIDYVQRKANEGIVNYYRPKKISKKSLKNSGVVIGGLVRLGQPSEEKFHEIIDSIKIARKTEEGYKDRVLITIPMSL
ncbi:hypothetical protein A2914_02910 [Candidatus Nomurabacteria bacterium RIFCSPLOWO2_01_FULL_41_21]|uniref:Uncharacterized protein n=2 Tax=Candidatus Nomuraibacteriota TaxID=1752729 RepID=A0A1F6V3X9_9BACT|nr:MAG: hypothetical protein A2733_00960 [Candidatus Nomurabacteria bacterium RIFCSPHIGHO2_01_FULL_40_20]OGI88883.1 MAG: hypothetical protein A2914_02910 [Candidatus Nomurabacteria bacterium RIFCSPLOWO2_01_FULL_41_21]